MKTIPNDKNPNQPQAFAGLDPAGQMDNTGHMVKRGSSYLRYAFKTSYQAHLDLLTAF